MKITPIKALTDNYIWAIHSSKSCIIIDPGEASVAIEFLTANKLTLEAILITHHHYDHTDGIRELLNIWPKSTVVGHKKSPNKHITKHIETQPIEILGINITPIPTPGHTLCHLTYFINKPFKAVFTGDTLFSAGCGKIFEGTPKMMLDSLQTLTKLPESTYVYCGHEYTKNNLKFAKTADPTNNKINELIKKTYNQEITLPSSIGIEKQINPFLRAHTKSIQNSIKNKFNLKETNLLETFSLLRQWKNNF
jgi:hydroxyacylglutathione hydrolase